MENFLDNTMDTFLTFILNSILHFCRAFFSVQFYTKTAVLNGFVQF